MTNIESLLHSYNEKVLLDVRHTTKICCKNRQNCSFPATYFKYWIGEDVKTVDQLELSISEADSIGPNVSEEKPIYSSKGNDHDRNGLSCSVPCLAARTDRQNFKIQNALCKHLLVME